MPLSITLSKSMASSGLCAWQELQMSSESLGLERCGSTLSTSGWSIVYFALLGSWVCTSLGKTYVGMAHGTENFLEDGLRFLIKDQGKVSTATGNGKAPFVSADDIAAVAYRALTDKKSHNTDHVILGPELLNYDEVRSNIFFSFLFDPESN